MRISLVVVHMYEQHRDLVGYQKMKEESIKLTEGWFMGIQEVRRRKQLLNIFCYICKNFAKNKKQTILVVTIWIHILFLSSDF